MIVCSNSSSTIKRESVSVDTLIRSVCETQGQVEVAPESQTRE
jgi:hypothetical protein